MPIARIALTNPISHATIREVEFVSILELNAFLASVAETRLYGYRILGTANGNYHFKREAGYLPKAA